MQPLPVKAAPATFEELFHAHYARIARLIWRVSGNNGEAEDLAAEVFIRFHRKPPATHENVEGWLCRTAVHLALDSLRRTERRSKYEEISPPPKAPPDPYSAAEAEGERQRVRAVLAAIKPEQSTLLLLRAEGYTYAEIAEQQNIHPASAGTYIARAEEAFRKEYVTRYGKR